MINLNLNAATRWGLNGALILAGVVALYLGHSIFIPTTLALFLAAMLWPAVVWLHRGVPVPWLALHAGFPWLRPTIARLPIPWTLACTFMVAVLVAVAVLVTLGFGLAIPKMLQDLPTDEHRWQEVYSRFRDRLRFVSPVPLDPEYFPEAAQDSKFVQVVREALTPARLLNYLQPVAILGVGWIWQWILIMFILLFLLLEGRMLIRRVVEVFGPSAEVQAKVIEALKDMAGQVRTYLVWRTIVNFALGAILGLVYQWAGLSQPWTWAMLTAILCYVPYLGPIAAGIPPVLDAFISSPSPAYAVGILLFYLVIINIEGYLIVPVVMGRPMELNATTVLLACLFWDLVWGTPGLFLAMPLMAAIKAVCTHVPDWQPWANLMSTREPVPEPPPAVEEILGEEPVPTDKAPRAPVGMTGHPVLKGK